MALRLNSFITKGLQQWAYNVAGFNKYGLHRDDLLRSSPDVDEALRRLPKHLVDARNFRIVRALQLDCQKRLLPKEQWTKLEEDELYLHPYLEEVIKEREEKEAWNTE